jgi:SAM-dependent methyltransferase
MAIHPQLVGRTCYHRYEVEDGFSTPGEYFELDPKTCLDELGVPATLTGLRALDIGAWDGPFTFELEHRGADVTALDIQNPDVTVFNAVKAIKHSHARYVQGGVYEASPEALGTFDLVLFAGVYYHLKNPVVALQRIRRLLKDDGLFFIEGAAATDYMADQLVNALGVSKKTAAETADIIDHLPISYFDTEQRIYGDWSNWFFPTTRCLEVMMQDSGFRNVTLELKRNGIYNYSHRRLMGSAQADPENANPQEQVREHGVANRDPGAGLISASETKGPLRWLPPSLRPTARRLRGAVRKQLAR